MTASAAKRNGAMASGDRTKPGARPHLGSGIDGTCGR